MANKPRYTIFYGWACNEGPNGEMQGGPSFTSRLETTKEQAETARYAEAAFRKAGVQPCKADVFFYGDIAKVHVRGKVITVKPSDLCPDDETTVSYVVGDLPQDKKQVVEAHLPDCEECRAKIAVLSSLI
jgi:hypothetical protein